MIKHKRSGFTVVELIIVIVVIGVLATITAIAYRSTQAAARDEKRKADVVMLKGALSEYHSNHGTYPNKYCSSGPGSTSECWYNEVWKDLKDEGLIQNIPTPGSKSSNVIANVNPDGTTNYAWLYKNADSYVIRVQLENELCRTGNKTPESWEFGGEAECNF